MFFREYSDHVRSFDGDLRFGCEGQGSQCAITIPLSQLDWERVAALIRAQ